MCYADSRQAIQSSRPGAIQRPYIVLSTKRAVLVSVWEAGSVSVPLCAGCLLVCLSLYDILLLSRCLRYQMRSLLWWPAESPNLRSVARHLCVEGGFVCHGRVLLVGEMRGKYGAAPGMRVYGRGYMRELRHAFEMAGSTKLTARSLGGVLSRALHHPCHTIVTFHGQCSA
jgi:hypothetical protein